MSTTQNEKCKGKHFIWSKHISHMLLEILVEEALKGNKPGIITKLKNKRGFGWDDCLKMITVLKDVYDEEAHPNHDKYVNKKLDMYEAMIIVVGKDMTTGNYAKSYADVNLEENIEEQSISIENEGEYEETLKGKETSASNVAFAIQSLSKNQLDVNELYTEVMKIEGFDEIILRDTFYHLNFMNQHCYKPDC
ncbi:hypothetical protein Peur_008181 [Populus x canadensis]